MNRKSFIADSLMALAVSMLPKSLLPISLNDLPENRSVKIESRGYSVDYVEEGGLIIATNWTLVSVEEFTFNYDR